MALYTSLPWNLKASIGIESQSECGQIASVTDVQISTLKQEALQGKRMPLSNWKKMLDRFIPYVFDPDYIGPERDMKCEKFQALSDEARNQKLNDNIQDSIDGTCDQLKCDPERDDKILVSDEVFWGIINGLENVNCDIQVMAHFKGKCDTKTFCNLVDYFSDIPYGDCLLSEDRKEIVEAIITTIVSIPARILEDEDWEDLNACCFRLWKNLQNDTLWEEAAWRSEEIQDPNQDLSRFIENLKKIVLQRDSRHCDITNAVIHMADCLTGLNDIQRNLMFMEAVDCRVNVSNLEKMSDLFKKLLLQPGLSVEEKHDLKVYILCVIASSSDDVLGKEYRSRLFADIQSMGACTPFALYHALM